jgi:sodium transport system permease protein
VSVSSPPTPTGRALRAVLRTEFLGLVRDRRAIFTAFVLPILLYPFLFLGQGQLKEFAEESLDAKEVTIAYDLSEAPEGAADRLIELLELETPIVLHQLSAGSCSAIEGVVQEGTAESWQRERELVLEVMGPGSDLLLYAVPDPTSVRGTLFRMHFDGADDTAQEARDRTRTSLRALETEQRAERIEELLGEDPAAALVVESRDLASEEDLGGAMLGRILPLIAVLVLLSGGSYAALAAFAGEREAGTLETLLVQPVSGTVLVWGKFLSVLLVGLVALVLNLGSLLASFALGLGSIEGFEGDVSGPGVARVLTAGLIFIPVCVFLCALLCTICGRARSFREGQHYLLPLSLLCMVPCLLALQPEVELDWFLACLPLAGPALAFREAMIGHLELLPGLVAFCSTGLYAVLSLRYLGSLLDGEKALGGGATAAENSLRRVQSRQALTFGFAGVLAVYLVGGLLQSWHPTWGLAATLWLLLPLLAFYSVSGTARRANESIPRALRLRLPSPMHAVGALLLAPALARFASIWIEWQQKVLPLPSSMTDSGALPEEITSLSPLLLFLLLALSPGICEELFFRGAVLSGLRRDFSAWKVILWQAILFGAVHASIYRFAPTALLGGLLAAITLRSRSIWPAVLLHVFYNGTLVVWSETSWFGEWWVPWLVLPGLGLFLVRRPTS